jgi:propionyl-CoA synthetase
MGRTDDIINIAGHRLSTGAIEEVLAEHPDIVECAVIGAADSLKGEVPVALIVLTTGTTRATAEIISDVIGMVRDRIGPVASFKAAAVVDRLPKTRSGKIVRHTIKRIADGLNYQMPPTIEDPSTIEEMVVSLLSIVYPMIR